MRTNPLSIPAFVHALALILLVWVSTARAGELQDALRASYAAEAKGNYTEALRLLQDVQTRESRNYFLQMRLGYLNLTLKQYAASMSAYQEADRLDTRAVEPSLGALKGAMALGKWADAEKWANDVLKRDAANYSALSSLAYACFVRKDYAKAVKYYEQVVELYPSDTTMKNGLAWSLLYQGFKSKAEAVFSEVLAVSPDDANTRQGLAASK